VVLGKGRGVRSLGYFVSVLVFVFPGYILFSLLWKNQPFSFWEKTGISSALSLSLYPLLYLWFSVFHITPGRFLPWGVVCVSLLFSLKIWKKELHLLLTWKPGKQLVFSILFFVVVGCVAASRIYIVKNMTGPAWGDSVNHTFIVQLFRDNGGLFQSWAPYAPIESFSYHFGFHSAVCSFAELAGIPSPQAVLMAGQVFNVLAVLALYPLVLRFFNSQWAALGGLLFAGLLFPLPGYFVNWGRYTQLSAQIILPIVILFLHFLSAEKTRLHPGFWILFGILLSGLALTHYRVAFLGAAAFLAWFLWDLWIKRKSLSLWFRRWAKAGLVVIGSFLVILPWIIHVRKSRMFDLAAINGEASSQAFYSSHFGVWKNTDTYFSDIFWIGGLLILIFFFWRRRQTAFPVLGWGVFCFIAANPRLIGLPGDGVVPNEILVFALYIPLALLFGWFLGVVWEWSLKLRWGVPVIIITAALLVFFGMKNQLTLVDPFFQLLLPEDLKAFEWIEEKVPEDAFFLVNGFVMEDWQSAAGSDSGWWLPFYTRRKSTVPPALYAIEELSPGIEREMYAQIVREVRESGGRVHDLGKVLCKYGITHVFLGSKRGGAAYEPDSQLIPERWLRDNKDFHLVFQEGKAQVWAFDRENCE